MKNIFIYIFLMKNEKKICADLSWATAQIILQENECIVT